VAVRATPGGSVINPPSGNGQTSLKRSLGLRHVFALSTGAMLSSGLFLLPGIAAAETGPSVVLAYLVAGALAVPPMLAVAELSTALPRAGGAYYFLERALGPAVGTVAGMSTWLSLVLKDAFALVGMSAYLKLVFDVPSKPLAVVLIVGFTVINILGSKASASLQLTLVAFVLAVMAAYLLAGLPNVASGDGELSPFVTDGATGLAAAVGLVFVSYGGLTKVASVAEEVTNPSRAIPLGMALSLLTSTTVYTLGVLVAVAVVPAEVLHDDLAPIHTAAEVVMPGAGVVLVVVAALAAFSSATNAGILAAARYPMAMSRDGLVSSRFQQVTRFDTPAAGIVVTGAGMAAVVVLFDVGAIAKLASAFVLLTLGMVNSAVLVLRASRIPSYAPGFRAPLYPWLQLFGMGVAIFLIIELGALALALTACAIVVAVTWYVLYGRPRSRHSGAIYHVFERWGRLVDRGLDREISEAMKSHGLRPDDEYPGLIARAAVISLSPGLGINDAAERAAEVLGLRLELAPSEVTRRFLDTGSLWVQPSSVHPTATPVAFFDDPEEHLVIVRAEAGSIRIPASWGGHGERVSALFFLAGSTTSPGRALRLAGELAAFLHTEVSVGNAVSEVEVMEALLPDRSIGQYALMPELATSTLIGRRVADVVVGSEYRLEAVRRDGRVLRPIPDLVLVGDDQITITGPPGHLPGLDDVTSILWA
jgi:amino acid transporter